MEVGAAVVNQLLPHDVEAEEAVIGAMLVTGRAIEDVLPVLTSTNFYSARLGAVFDCLTSMHEAGYRPDALTVTVEMERRYPSFGVRTTDLLQLQSGTPTTTNAAHYAEIVAGHAARRSAIALLSDATGSLYEGQDAHKVMSGLLDKHDMNAGTSRSSWQEVDLEPLWDMPSAEVFPAPELLRRTDGVHLLSPGATGLLIAPPESAKSMMAMAAVVEAAMNGRHSIYVDFESRARRVLPRLAQHLDGHRARGLFHYLRPTSAMASSDRWLARRRMVELRPQLVVLDGYNALLAKHNLDGNKATDIAALAESVVSPWTAEDCCTVIIDHVSKDDARMTGLRMAIGSIAKTGMVDYAISLDMVVKERIAKGRTGRVALTIAKDRDGEMRGHAHEGAAWGSFSVNSTATGRWQHALTMPEGMSGPAVRWR